MTSGKRYWSDGTPVAGQQFEYGFDDIGNRTSTKAGGDQSGPGRPSGSGKKASGSGLKIQEMVSITKHPALEVKSLYSAQRTETGNVFVPPQTETYQHDSDGSLTLDGRWNYTWYAENRLVQMLRDAASPSGANQKLVFEYDHQGRRIRKAFSVKNGDNWVEQSDRLHWGHI